MILYQFGQKPSLRQQHLGQGRSNRNLVTSLPTNTTISGIITAARSRPVVNAIEAWISPIGWQRLTMLDLLIKNGQVIDGSGSPGFYSSVLVENERVAIHRGDASHLGAARVIDATGLVVCPGFIDLHSHAGLTILGEPHHDPKVRQGVTTELVGIDGISHAPFKNQEELHRYIWLDSGLNGYPPLPTDWLTVADLLNKYDNQVAINIAYILGNSPVRIWGVGWNDRPATGLELEEMKSVVREAMEEGAWGLSTGLDYPPGAYADTDELVALAAASARLGGFYHTHTRGILRAKGL